jgi:hypothetical protein
MDLDRRTFTAGLAGAAFFTTFAGVSRAQQYDAFFQACVATGKESEVCLGFVQSWTAAQFKERFYR